MLQTAVHILGGHAMLKLQLSTVFYPKPEESGGIFDIKAHFLISKNATTLPVFAIFLPFRRALAEKCLVQKNTKFGNEEAC